MDGKKGSAEIDIPNSVSSKVSDEGDSEGGDPAGDFVFGTCFMQVLKFCKEDMNRVIFSLKVGFAILLVSLLTLLKAPYNVLGESMIWSILTVAIMFEYTVGATFNRGFNRAVGSIVAGILAYSVGQFALDCGHVAEPVIIGISIFFIGTVTSFMKLWPCLAPYDYGFRVVLFTYCLIIVSGYRFGSPLQIAYERLYSIAIGGVVAVLVNVLIFPVWAGEQLHHELVTNFNSIADALEECVEKYLADEGVSSHSMFLSPEVDEFSDEPAYKNCRSTLNSAEKLETLANLASWEPPHGRFNQFQYPWSEFVKVGAVLRYCAYEVMALHGVLHSGIQAPYNLRITFQKEIQGATSAAAELVRFLGNEVRDMNRTQETNLQNKAHLAAEHLQRAVDLHYYRLTEPVCCLENRLKPPPANKLSSQTEDESDDQFNGLKLMDEENLESFVAIQIDSSYHEKLPSEEEAGFIPRMRGLESTAQLSLATFTSLIIEFITRLDYLVEAVDELSKMGNFKVPSL